MLKGRKMKFAMPLAAIGLMLFCAVAIYAGTDAPDVIRMESPAYEHTKGIVEFTHKAHIEDYEIGCGECHHDESGTPLVNLKLGVDNVQKCIECHSKPGEIKGKEAQGLSDEEKRQYHVNALHDNCRDCHRQHNREQKTKAAPTTCTGCHPKEKK